MLIAQDKAPSLRTTIQAQFNKAAHSYDQHAIVQKKIIDSLIKLSEITMNTNQKKYPLCLDLGCGTGSLGQALQYSQPNRSVIGIDLADEMLKTHSSQTHLIHGDFHQLPFQAEIFDELYSSSALHWAHDMNQVSQEMARVLKPGGSCCLGLFIAGSLQEIQTSWLQTDQTTHTMNFLSIQNYEDLLKASGFKILKTQILEISLPFDSPKDALISLKRIGSKWFGQKSSLIPLSQFKKFEKHYRDDYGDGQSFVPLTYRVGLLVLEKNNTSNFFFHKDQSQ